MSTRIAIAGIVLAVCVNGSVALAQPKILAKDVPTPKDRCLLTCDALQRQCVMDAKPGADCTTAHTACRDSCELAPPPPEN